jgi:phage/plasmid-associated DNA primase
MRYGKLEAAITHALAERGELDDNGNPIAPKGKLYNTYEEYAKAEGKEDKIRKMLSRVKTVDENPSKQ